MGAMGRSRPRCGLRRGIGHAGRTASWTTQPWQKPTVENTNGLIREFFPKGTDFSRVSDEEVRHVYQLINDRPRKVLGFKTANEVYREMLHSA